MRRSLLCLSLLLVLASQARGEVPANPEAPFLVVRVTDKVASDITGALDMRDLERYVVSEFIRRRIENVLPFTSVKDHTVDSSEDLIRVEVTLDQADVATRPLWSFSDGRYKDDEILHVEFSMEVTPGGDPESAVGFHDMRDFRAAEYGHFSSPQALRGAIYEAASTLTEDFAKLAQEGELGDQFRDIQRPYTFKDALAELQGPPTARKLALAGGAVVVLVVFFLLLIRVIVSTARVLAGITPRPTTVVYRELRPLKSRVIEPLPVSEEEPEELLAEEENEELLEEAER